jgi:hypothetical protein
MFARTTAASADESDDEFDAASFRAGSGAIEEGGLTTEVDRWDIISQVTAAPRTAENSIGHK